MWKIGNGQKVKFWEDNWLGTSSLSIQFWRLYEIANEKTGTVCELWDGTNLRCTFRRTVDQCLMNEWLEVLQLASTIVLSFEEDALIWQFSSNGVYNSQSLYRIINCRGVFPVHVSAVWSLKVPPRVHFFLWLLAKNKVLTRDNLGLRQKIDDDTCLFCFEKESVFHLFFDCVVAKQVWVYISVGFNVGMNFESIGSMWLSRKRFIVHNILTSAVLWGLWKLRNELCFQNTPWRDIRILLMRVTVLAQNWLILCPEMVKSELSGFRGKLKQIAVMPGQITG